MADAERFDDRPPAMPPAPRSFVAFDPGQRRVGVATGNTLTRHATPLTTIAAEGEPRFAAIGRLLGEWRPDALVVGVPFHPDGAAHENTARARRFARQLRGRFGLAVHEVDERYSTVEAARGGARDLDAAAAAVILEQFLAGVSAAGSRAPPTQPVAGSSATFAGPPE